MIVMIEKNQAALDEINSTAANIDHLESILFQKKKLRRNELDRIRKDLDNAIRAYSNVIMKLLA